MKIQQEEMAAYHMQKEISRFYAIAIRVVWGIAGILMLWTGFRVFVEDDFSYINGMMWYLVPAFVLGLITLLLWVLRKREQNKTYQIMLSRRKREKPNIQLAAKFLD